MKRQERVEMILEKRAGGQSLSSIGEEMGISKQRVHQLIKETEKQQRLDAIARDLGLGSWSQLERKILKKEIEITIRVVTRGKVGASSI